MAARMLAVAIVLFSATAAAWAQELVLEDPPTASADDSAAVGDAITTPEKSPADKPKVGEPDGAIGAAAAALSPQPPTDESPLGSAPSLAPSLAPAVPANISPVGPATRSLAAPARIGRTARRTGATFRTLEPEPEILPETTRSAAPSTTAPSTTTPLTTTTAPTLGEQAWGEWSMEPTFLPQTGVTFSVEYIEWKPRLGALDIAVVDPDVIDGAVNGTLASLNHDREGGIRLSLGYDFIPQWDMRFVYVSLDSDTSLEVAAPAAGQLWPTFTQAGFPQITMTQAAAMSRIDYQTFDIEFGHSIYATEFSTVRLHGGWRFASMDQELTVNYAFPAFNTSTDILSLVEMDGSGPRVGGTIWCHLTKGFSAYASAASALIMADYEATLLANSSSGGTPIPNVFLFDAYRRVLPVAEVGLGVQWQNGPWYVATGWELTHYNGAVDAADFPSANQAIVTQAGRSIRRVADVSFDGWFLRGGVSW